MSSPQYEFDSKQNQIISQLSDSMHWIAVPLQLIGILYGLAVVSSIIHAFREPSALFGAIYGVLGMVFFLVLGNWNRNSARAFGQVAKTSGQDVTHLMEALDNLRKTYALLSIFVKVYIALILFTVIAALILAIVWAIAWAVSA